MKKIFILLNTFIILFAFTSCNEWLDVNTDPDNPAETSVELVLPAAQASVAVTMSGNLLFNLGGFFAQYWDQNPTANQYNDQSQYSLQTDNYNNVWDELYSGALNDLNYILNESEANESWGNYLIATTLRAYVYQYLVDLHDKVPYTEALLGAENLTPHFDDGSVIYQGILDELDNALAKPLNSSTVFASSDMFLNSSLDKWVAFARTLKLKILLRMAYTSDPHTTEIAALLTDGIFITEDVGIGSGTYVNEQNKRNPWFETNVSRLSGDGPNSINHVGSENFISYLLEKSDPRIDKLFNKPLNGGSHFGNYFGSSKDAGSRKSNAQADFSTPKIAFNHPSFLMLNSEALLLQAEAQVRVNSDLGKAKTLYDAAVAASFDTEGVTDSPDTYIGTGGSYEFTASTSEEAIEQIIMQKWVCLAHYNNIEAWIEQTRTGYPQISAVPASDETYVAGEWTSPIINGLGDGNFPKRMYYPESEVSSNPNTPEQINSIAASGIWWDEND